MYKFRNREREITIRFILSFWLEGGAVKLAIVWIKAEILVVRYYFIEY